MSLPDNLNYLFYKKYFTKYSREEFMKHYCEYHCCDMYDSPCENCKKKYQEWSSNYIFEEGELDDFKLICHLSDFVDVEGGIDNIEALKSEFFEKMWPIDSIFFEESFECQKSCAYGNHPPCSSCKYFEEWFYPEAKKLGFCQVCFENYVKKRKNDILISYGYSVGDLHEEMDFNNCLKCQDVVCPHYYNRMNGICDHCNFVNFINKRYQLDKYVVNLIQHLELKYMPGGEGALEALKNFNSSHEKWNKKKDIKK